MKISGGPVAASMYRVFVPLRCAACFPGRAPGLMQICLLVALPFLLLGGCAVGPDFTGLDAPVEQQWLDQRDARIKAETADTAAWWTVFNDPVLDNLVRKAEEQNLDLRAAALRIMEARARLGIVAGLQYPQTQEIGAEASVNQLSDNAPNAASANRYYNNYSLGFDAAWELDFWGRFRRGVESETAGLYVTMADYDSMLVSLTAEVARTYVVIRTTEKRLDLARENIQLQEQSLRIAQERFRDGAASELDVAQARALLAQTQSTVPRMEAGLRQAKNSLAVLLGMLPSKVDALITGPAAIPTAPVEVVVGIPAELLRRRPDIRQAEFQAAAQSARIGLAKADLFPKFSLVGSIGLQSSSLGGVQSNDAQFGDLFTADSITYFLGPTLQWPILNYGRLKNNVRMQDARFQQLVENYKNTVLKAVREVEDAMVGFLKSGEAEGFIDRSVKSYSKSVEIAMLQYRDGDAGYQRVIDTQRYLARAQDEHASTVGAVAENLIALYKALGGGWQTRADKPLLPESIIKQMQNRTDWGSLLGNGNLPDIRQKPPTGQAVPIMSTPRW